MTQEEEEEEEEEEEISCCPTLSVSHQIRKK